MSSPDPRDYIKWFRSTSPYINNHRNKTFVIAFGGEAVNHKNFDHVIHDIALLASLGIRLVLVHGARPQINQRLQQQQISSQFAQNRRITDQQSLPGVLEAIGHVRIQIEALLSMGVANSPMHGAALRVASGNMITARPHGIHEGIDFQHTGEIRKINTEAIQQSLNHNAIVLLSSLGYSPTGEVFNLAWEDVGEKTAIALEADKFILLTEEEGLLDAHQQLIRELTTKEAQQLLTPGNQQNIPLHAAINACQQGVNRSHFISFQQDGALLQELFSHDGSGTLLSHDDYEQIRTANIDDIGGILELIAPLERDGILVRRSRELLESGIGQFTITERDGMIIACSALNPFSNEHCGELSCVAVHPDYRQAQRGDQLLYHIEKQARSLGLTQLFVLTTQTAHWFIERGFKNASLEILPKSKQSLYNYQRNSKAFIKTL